jgi:hypothetical protein
VDIADKKAVMGLKQDIETFKNGMKRDLVQQKRLAARIALKKLLNRSPARSGNYMRSHNVGISKTATGRGIGKRHAPVNNAYLPKMSKTQQLALAAELYNKKNGYISSAQLGDAITIYNIIPYANQVEYLGWSGVSKKYGPWQTPAYHVYGLTVAELEIIMPLLPKLTSGNISAGAGIV